MKVSVLVNAGVELSVFLESVVYSIGYLSFNGVGVEADFE